MSSIQERWHKIRDWRRRVRNNLRPGPEARKGAVWGALAAATGRSLRGRLHTQIRLRSTRRFRVRLCGCRARNSAGSGDRGVSPDRFTQAPAARFWIHLRSVSLNRTTLAASARSRNGSYLLSDGRNPRGNHRDVSVREFQRGDPRQTDPYHRSVRRRARREHLARRLPFGRRHARRHPAPRTNRFASARAAVRPESRGSRPAHR